MSSDVKPNASNPSVHQHGKTTTLSPHSNQAPVPSAETSTPAAIQVNAGIQLPPSAAVVPILGAQQVMPVESSVAGNSAIAAGMNFQGNAIVNSGCVVAGNFIGNLSQAEGVQVVVTVTESGSLKGDVKAHQIVVMGRTQGLLDASAGVVVLHESANVQGHVRYAKLQVNGAELNATLEKSTTTRNGQ
jgi:cytoskeletal protein CcmA (bactofilin family)